MTNMLFETSTIDQAKHELKAELDYQLAEYAKTLKKALASICMTEDQFREELDALKKDIEQRGGKYEELKCPNGSIANKSNPNVEYVDLTGWKPIKVFNTVKDVVEYMCGSGSAFEDSCFFRFISNNHDENKWNNQFASKIGFYNISAIMDIIVHVYNSKFLPILKNVIQSLPSRYIKVPAAMTLFDDTDMLAKQLNNVFFSDIVFDWVVKCVKSKQMSNSSRLSGKTICLGHLAKMDINSLKSFIVKHFPSIISKCQMVHIGVYDFILILNDGLMDLESIFDIIIQFQPKDKKMKQDQDLLKLYVYGNDLPSFTKEQNEHSKIPLEDIIINSYLFEMYLEQLIQSIRNK